MPPALRSRRGSAGKAAPAPRKTPVRRTSRRTQANAATATPATTAETNSASDADNDDEANNNADENEAEPAADAAPNVEKDMVASLSPDSAAMDLATAKCEEEPVVKVPAARGRKPSARKAPRATPMSSRRTSRRTAAPAEQEAVESEPVEHGREQVQEENEERAPLSVEIAIRDCASGSAEAEPAVPAEKNETVCEQLELKLTKEPEQHVESSEETNTSVMDAHNETAQLKLAGQNEAECSEAITDHQQKRKRQDCEPCETNETPTPKKHCADESEDKESDDTAKSPRGDSDANAIKADDAASVPGTPSRKPNDDSSQQRNKRMFGLITNTLRKASVEQAQMEGTMKKREDILSTASQRLTREQAEHETREKRRNSCETSFDDARAGLARWEFLGRISYRDNLNCFLQLTTNPPLYWRPTKHTDKTKRMLEDQIALRAQRNKVICKGMERKLEDAESELAKFKQSEAVEASSVVLSAVEGKRGANE